MPRSKWQKPRTPWAEWPEVIPGQITVDEMIAEIEAESATRGATPADAQGTGEGAASQAAYGSRSTKGQR